MPGPERQSGKGQRKPHPIDVVAGRNLRLARIHAGYSQERLADAVGLTFQQIQKYEAGTNRISISRAHEFTLILNISISDFFEDNEAMPSSKLLDQPYFPRWMALYGRAQSTERLSEIVDVVEEIVTMCETQEPRTALCM